MIIPIEFNLDSPEQSRKNRLRLMETFAELEEAVPVKKDLRLFHVSHENHNGDTFLPRVPQNKMTAGKAGDDLKEDSVTPRVCFGTSVRRAITALPGQRKIKPGDEFYVHIPADKHAIFKPTTEEVPDAKDSYEYWVTEPVKLKCIGKITVTKKNIQNSNWSPGCWDYEWTERY